LTKQEGSDNKSIQNFEEDPPSVAAGIAEVLASTREGGSRQCKSKIIVLPAKIKLQFSSIIGKEKCMVNL
jgi:hypothetical protein